MIEARHIIKRYGDLEVLRGVDVTIGEAEVVTIVGPSGAGKTTLLQIIGTLDLPDDGQVTYDGVDVLGDSNVITGRGPGAAEEFSMEIVKTLCGQESFETIRKAALLR